MTPRREDAIAAELRWYWAAAQGAMGLRSNYMAIMGGGSRSAARSGKPVLDIDERCLAAATVEKRVRRALAQVSDREAAILVHAFGPDIRELAAFGPATGVVPLTGTARQRWVASRSTRSLEDWLARLVVRVHTGRSNDLARDVVLLKAIRTEAEQMLRGALQAYAEHRHSGRAGMGTKRAGEARQGEETRAA